MNQENTKQPDIGNIFKEAREAKKLSLEDVSKGTKVHINILKAIESDDVKNMGIVYAKSFLKIYSHYLGLDTADILRRFHEGLEPDELSEVRNVSFPNSDPSRLKIKRRPLLLRRINSLFFMLRPLARNIDFKKLGIVVLAVFLFIGAVKLFSRPRHNKKPVAAVSVESHEVALKAKKASKPVTSAPESSAKVETVVSKKQGNQSEKIVLVVKAREKCWLQVKVDGKVVFWSVLPKGAAESWQAKDKIELRLGNAGAVELELNGKVLERIGRPGQSLKNVVITREGLSVKD